jgi:aminoglycoside phosphotransferase (APT) family kinase protein
MKVEIINKPMLCWDDDEANAREFHVLAKVTECDATYPYKVIYTENTLPNHPEYAGMRRVAGCTGWFKNAKPLPETIELTVAEISKILGKTVKIVK